MDTLHLSTAWFETGSGWRAFRDPAVVPIPIAESDVRLSERRVSGDITLAVLLIGVPVALWLVELLVLLIFYGGGAT